MLEMQIGWWSGSGQGRNPVFENIALGERPMSIRLGEFVGVEIFSSCLSSGHQEQVISPKAGWVRCDQETVDKHGKGDSAFLNGGAKGKLILSTIGQTVTQAGEHQQQTQERGRCDKGKEVAVVPSANAIVEPHTVMVQGFNAIVADSTMITSWRSPDIT